MLAGSSYTLSWLGFEGCCGGAATVRYSVDDGAYQIFDSSNGSVNFAMPDPSVALLPGLGLIGLAAGGGRTE